MKKINPLVITAAFAIAGIYIGIVKVAGRGIERIVDILLAAFTVDTAIDLVCSLLFTAIGFFCVRADHSGRHLYYGIIYQLARKEGDPHISRLQG